MALSVAKGLSFIPMIAVQPLLSCKMWPLKQRGRKSQAHRQQPKLDLPAIRHVKLPAVPIAQRAAKKQPKQQQPEQPAASLKAKEPPLRLSKADKKAKEGDEEEEEEDEEADEDKCFLKCV